MTKGRTVIISGANGFFGSIASEFFRDSGWKVIRATRSKETDLFFSLDEPEEFAKLSIDLEVDLFIHAAAAHEVSCNKQPYVSIAQNVIGTKSALDFCVRNGIKRFVYLSTFHVFGNLEGVITEDTKPEPINDYGLSHLQAEEYVQMYSRQSKIDGIIIRPTNFFGTPSDLEMFNRWTLVPYAFCREAISHKKISLKTPGFQKRNFISAHDICKVIDKIVCDEYIIPLLHVYGPNNLTIRELANLVSGIVKEVHNIDVQLDVPSGINNESSYEFSSKILADLYLPKGRIEDFFKEFTHILLNK